MRSGWVSLVAMYAAAKVPTLPAAEDGLHPNRMASQNAPSTAKKITKYTTTATVPYSVNSFWTVFFTDSNAGNRKHNCAAQISAAAPVPSPKTYTDPSAVIGSALVALCAGTAHAAKSATVNAIPTTPNTSGSVRPTPNSYAEQSSRRERAPTT
jgi:hypothetical protein